MYAAIFDLKLVLSMWALADRYGQQMPEGRKQQLRRMVLQHAGESCVTLSWQAMSLCARWRLAWIEALFILRELPALATCTSTFHPCGACLKV